MKSQYPENLEFEIDREFLGKYLKTTYWFSFAFILVGAFSFIWVISIIGEVINHPSEGMVTQFIIEGLILYSSIFTFIFLFYFLLVRWLIKSHIKILRINVEESFLRIINGSLFTKDRKIHFNAITDYSVIEGPVSKFCNIKELCMRTADGPENPAIRIWGIKDTEKVRDILAEIDAERENR